MSSTSFVRTGQWFIAPDGVSVFDGAKDEPKPRPIVAFGSYGGFVRMLGRSTKPLDDTRYKVRHIPHRGTCDGGSGCMINEEGYVSIRPSDILDPIVHGFRYDKSCFEPDEDFIEALMKIVIKR